MSSNFSLKSIGSAFFLQMVVVLRVLRHSFGWGSFWDLNFKRNEVSWPLNLMTLKRRRGKRLECHTNSQMIFPQKEPEKRKDIKDRHVLGFFKLLFFAHRSISALPPISRLTLEKKFLLPPYSSSFSLLFTKAIYQDKKPLPQNCFPHILD